ncbi:MAG: hypothetical protein QOC81_4131 [Thermoanaerobaculia bacterium]|jgi:hypothetical protein|nr:hypothetical protein [Thermoanaerobaculia bacterium]
MKFADLFAILSIALCSLGVSDEVPKPSKPTLSVITNCTPQSVTMQDDVEITVTFANAGHGDLWLMGNLKWGFRGGMTLHVGPWSEDGPLPLFVDHGEFTPNEINDESRLVRLQGDTFFGCRRTLRVDQLVRKPGTYRIWVEYLSPLPAGALRQVFWSAEQGSSFSNAVILRVAATTKEVTPKRKH